MSYGSSASIVKNAVYVGLTTALGADAAVLYDSPVNPDHLVSTSEERVFVAFGDEVTGTIAVDVFNAGELRYDETLSIPLVVMVIDEQATAPADEKARQLPIDQRLDTALGDVLTWFADQSNIPNSGGVANEVQIHWVRPTGVRRVSGVLTQTAGRWVAAEIAIEVFAHKEP